MSENNEEKVETDIKDVPRVLAQAYLFIYMLITSLAYTSNELFGVSISFLWSVGLAFILLATLIIVLSFQEYKR